MVETAAHLGVIAFIHRLGSSLNGQIHFHVCVVDGVFEEVAGEGDWATDWDGAAHCGGGSARYGLTAGAARVCAWLSKGRYLAIFGGNAFPSVIRPQTDMLN